MRTFFKFFAVAFAAVAMSANIASADVKYGVAAEPYPPFAEKGADNVLLRLTNRLSTV